MQTDRRLDRPSFIPYQTPTVSRRPVTFFWNGEPATGYEGEPVAVSLWALGVKVIGRHESAGDTRGLYCAIGHCFECRATVDGVPVQRTCLTPVREGMRVDRTTAPAPLDGGPGGLSDE